MGEFTIAGVPIRALIHDVGQPGLEHTGRDDRSARPGLGSWAALVERARTSA